jgi:hypothetical protein
LRKHSIAKKKGEIQMNRKLKWLIAVAVAGLLVMAIAIPVMAAGPNGANNRSANTVQPGYASCQGLGLGPDQAVLDLLGMTQVQIQELRQSGQSLVQIAATKSVTEVALVNAILAEKQAAIQKLVSAGTMTQAQADTQLAQIRERVQLAVNRTTVGPPVWAGSNGNNQNGAGMMGRSGSKGNQANCSGTPGTCTGTGSMMRTGRTAR